MQNLISQTFAISAQRPTVSIDHTDNYYLIEASGITPAANDARWQYVAVGGNALVPTAALPYLWHKSITYLTDGTTLPPVIEFGGSLGQNGIDYDLVPSHSSILKDENGNLTPADVSCTLIKRNADGSATNQTTIPAGYSIQVIKDAQTSAYSLGTTVSTSNCSVITFVLKYGSVEIERHDIRVIAEGTEGIAGRGIQSIDYRYKATEDGTVSATPTTENDWNTWSALQAAGYSSVLRYLWRCQRIIFVDGNGVTETQYSVDGPTVWGADGKDAIFLELDNEMDAIPADSSGKVLSNVSMTLHAKLYKGAAPITSGITAPAGSSIKIGNVTPTVSMASGEITITYSITANSYLSSLGITASKYAVQIPVTYDGKTYYATFVANIVKSGTPGVSPAIYQLLLSETVAAFSRNSSNQLTPDSIAVYCGYTKNQNGSISSFRGNALEHLHEIDILYSIFYRPIEENGTPGEWGFMKDLNMSGFQLVIPKDTTYTAYEFIMSDATTTNPTEIEASHIIDRETLPIKKDGINGNDGVSTFSIDLDNETDAFGTDSEGKITAAVTRTTTVKMYYGITPLALTNLTATKKYEDNTNCGTEVAVTPDKTTGVVTVTLNNTSFAYNKTIFIDITGTTARGSKTIRFSLQPQAAGAPGETPVIYQLMPTPSSLLFSRGDNNALVAEKNTVYAYVKVIEGESTEIKTSSLSGYRVYWGYDEPDKPSNYINVGGSKTVSVSDATAHESITLELWRMNGSTKLQRLDRETVPFNKEGEKGEKGDPGDDGITPFIIDIDNEMTSLPVDQSGQTTQVHDLYFNLAAYYGQTPVINDCTVEAVNSLASSDYITADVTTDKTRPHIQIQSGFGPVEMVELRFRVTHPTYGSREAVFSIAFVKAGGQGLNAVLYELLPSLSQIAVGRNDDGTYNPATVALTCGYKKIDGPAINTEKECTAAFDGYDIYFRRYLRTSGAWQTTYYRYRTYKSYLASLNVSTYSKVQFIICKNTSYTITNTNLDDTNVTGLVDRETVPVVADGLKGNNGTNAFVIDLDNEMDGCAVLLSGVASSTQQWVINAKAFYGATELTESSGVAFTLQGITGNNGLVTTNQGENGVIAGGVLTITSSSGSWTRDGVIHITIRATHATYGSRDAIFTLKPIFPGENGAPATVYNIKTDLTEIRFNRTASNGLTPNSRRVNVKIVKTDGATPTEQTIAASGLTVRYSTSSMPTSKTAGSALTSYVDIASGTASDTLYIAAFNSAGTLVDCETLPIVRDPENGNGISVDDFYYCLTATLAPPATATLDTANGWYKRGTTGCPTAPTSSMPFLWECEDIQYSIKTTDNKKVLRLFQVYDMSIQPNLLEQSAFDSEDVMTVWSVKNGEVIPQASGAYNAFGSFPISSSYRDILQQKVFKAGELSKIKSNTYYTLSFYARTRRMVNLTSRNYGFGTTEIYLHEGVYKLQFNGRCSTTAVNGGVALRGYLYGPKESNTGWDKSTNADVTGTTDETVTTGTLTVTTAGIYRITFYAYKQQGEGGGEGETVTVNWWRLLCTSDNSLIRTYIYPYGPVANSTYFVDGEVIASAAANDGNVAWQLDLDDDKADSGGWTRHTVTFLTRDLTTNLSSGVPVQRQILFRIYNTYVEICRPKLEECVIATDWCEHEYDSDPHCSHNPRGEWVNGATYFYCNGIRDVVQARMSAESTAKTWWRMKRRTNALGYTSTTQPYLDTEHWERADYLKFLATEVMFADEAYINNLLLNYAKARNINTNEITVSIDGTTGDIMAKGTIKVKALYTVEGGYKTVSGKKVVDLETNIGNTYVIPANTTVYLPDATDYEGLTLTFIFQQGGVLAYDSSDGIYMAYYTGSEYSNVIPSGMSPRAFHSLDGLETVTIHAIKVYGTNQVKWTLTGQRGILGVRGYVADADSYKLTPEGKLLFEDGTPKLKWLASGSVTGTNSGASVWNLACVSGFSVTVSRVSTGIYQLNFPNNYFSTITECRIIVIGRGSAYNDSTPLKANIHMMNDDSSNYYVRISTSDDASRNDGNFDFFIYRIV